MGGVSLKCTRASHAGRDNCAAAGGMVNLVYGCVKYICEMIFRPGCMHSVTLRQAAPSVRTPPHPITL